MKDVYINTSIGRRKLRDLVDFEAKKCFVLQKLAIDAKLSSDEAIAKRIQAIDDHII